MRQCSPFSITRSASAGKQKPVKCVAGGDVERRQARREAAREGGQARKDVARAESQARKDAAKAARMERNAAMMKEHAKYMWTRSRQNPPLTRPEPQPTPDPEHLAPASEPATGKREGKRAR